MELKIDIIDSRGNVEKTYSTQSFRLTMGVCEDILAIVDVDKMARLDKLSDEEAEATFLPMVVKLYGEFRPIMMQVFPELTEDEYRRADTSDVAGSVWKVVQYTMTQLFNVAEKN